MITVRVSERSDGFQIDAQFTVGVIRPLSLHRPDRPRPWRLSSNRYPVLFFTSDLCAIKDSSLIGSIATDIDFRNRNNRASFVHQSCTGRYLYRPTSFGNTFHALRPAEHEVLLPQLSEGVATLSVSFIYRTRAYAESGLNAEWYRQEFRIAYEYSEITLTIAGVTTALLPSGSKLATITFAHSIDGASWEFDRLDPPLVGMELTPVSGAGTEAVVALSEAITVGPVNKPALVTATIHAYSPNDASFLKQSRAQLVVKISGRNRPPAFAGVFADRQESSRQPVQFVFDQATDPEGDDLSYEAKLADGSDLPAAIGFVASTREFTVAAGAAPGRWSIRVRAFETANPGSYADQFFELRIVNGIVVDAGGLGVLDAAERPRATVAVRLDAQPAGSRNVTLTLSSSQPSALRATPTTMVFTPGNWNSPQQLVLALAGTVSKGRSVFRATVAVFGASGSATNYRRVAAVPVPVTVRRANAAPVFAVAARRRDVDENFGEEGYAAGAPLGAPVVATDADNTVGLVYSIRPASGVYAVDPASGQVMTRASINLNHERTDEFLLTLEVHDNEPLPIRQSATVTVQFNVIDIVETPGPYSRHDFSSPGWTGRVITLTWYNEEYTDQFYISDQDAVLLAYETGGGAAVVLEVDTGLDGDNATLVAEPGTERNRVSVTYVIASLAANTAYTISLGWRSEDDQTWWSDQLTVTTKLNLNSPPVFPPGMQNRSFIEGVGKELRSAGLKLTGGPSKIVTIISMTRRPVPVTIRSNPMVAEDEDDEDVVTYSLVGSGDPFRIDAATGDLFTAQTVNFNYEVRNRYLLTVQASDNFVPPATALVTLTISLLNLPELAHYTYPRGNFRRTGSSPTRITLAWSNADYYEQFDPADRASIVVSYKQDEALGTHAGTVVLAPDQEAVTLTGLHPESVYILYLQWYTHDNHYYSFGKAEQRIIWNNDVANTDPVFVGSSLAANRDENDGRALTPRGTEVGQLDATDAESAELLVYSALPGASAELLDVAADGMVTLAADINFDWEGKKRYTVNVQVEDGDGGSSTGQFVLALNQIDDRPVFASVLGDQRANPQEGRRIALPSATDDEGESLVYTVVLADGTSLSQAATPGISYDSGQHELVVAIGADLAVYQLKIVATETGIGGQSSEQAFSLVVAAGGIDVDGSALAAFTSDNRSQNLAVALAAAPDGQAVTVAVTSADPEHLGAAPSRLVFTPTTWNNPHNVQLQLLPAGAARKGNREVAVEFSVHAAATGAANYRGIMPVTVLASIRIPNAAPEFAAARLLRSINENARAETTPAGTAVGAPVTATDSDNRPDQLSYSLQGISPIFAVNAASGQIFLSAATNLDHERAAGYTITVVAEDNEAAEIRGRASVTVAITVLDINEVPMLAQLSDQTVIEGVGGSYQFAAVDDPDTDNTITYAASQAGGRALPAAIDFNAATRTFTFAASLVAGTLTLQVTASDGRESVQRTFVLQVKDAGGVVLQPASLPALSRRNRQAVFAVRLDVQPAAAAVTISLLSRDPADIAVLPVTMIFNRSNWNVPQNATLTLSRAGARQLADRTVDLSIGVLNQAAGDDFYRGSRPLVVAVRVANENAVPDFGAVERVFVIDAARLEEVVASRLIGTVTAADAESDQVIYRIAGGDDAAHFAIDPVRGRISIVAATDADADVLLEPGNSYSFVVEAQDRFSIDGQDFVGVASRLQVRVLAPVSAEEKVALASIDSAIALAASDMIQGRLAAPAAAGRSRDEPPEEPAWQRRAAAADQWRDWRGDDAHADGRIERTDWRAFVDSRGFDFALTRPGWLGPQLRLWGAGSRSSLAGNPLAGNVLIPYSGSVNVLMLGMEAGQEDRKLGVAAGRSKARLTMEGSGARVRRELFSLHPYASFRFGDRVRLWLSGGYGFGDYGRTGSGSREEVVDTRYLSAGGGLRTDFTSGGLEIGADFRVLHLQSKLEGSAQLPASKARSWRLQGGLEVGRTYSFNPQVTYKPFAGVDVRYDEGSGPFAYGQEVDATAGLNVNWQEMFTARIVARLQLHTGDAREQSVTGSIDYDYGADGRGLMLAVDTHAVGVADAPFAPAIGARAGYGLPLRLLGSAGIASFSAGLSYENADLARSCGLSFAGRLLELSLAGCRAGYTLNLHLR